MEAFENGAEKNFILSILSAFSGNLVLKIHDKVSKSMHCHTKMCWCVQVKTNPTRSLQCRKDFAVLGQFCAEIITLRL